jgi:hypothetical protein
MFNLKNLSTLFMIHADCVIVSSRERSLCRSNTLFWICIMNTANVLTRRQRQCDGG